MATYTVSFCYCFGVIAAYCSNFGNFAFLSHHLGGLGTTYDVHLGLIFATSSTVCDNNNSLLGL